MKKALLIIVALLVVVFAGGYGLVKYKNRGPALDLYAYWQDQDPVPVGKTAVFTIGLSTKEDFDPTWWYNVYQHIAHNIIPWPVRNLALADRGVALMDPQHDYSTVGFEPTDLVDRFGNERNMDGVPYIEKYRNGEVEWTPAPESIHLGTGNFVYTGRQDGIPTAAGKTISYARLWYYGRGIEGGKIPAPWQKQKIFDQAFEKLAAAHPDVEHRQADTMGPHEWRASLFELLDGGAETIVLMSPMVVYSDFEEFHNGFLHSVEMIREWEAQNGREIKVIIAPPMSHFKPMRDGYLLMLKDKLDTLPAGSSVKMVWSVHGMPWRVFPNESWLKLAPAYTDPLVAETEMLLSSYDFGKVEVVVSQDHFADHYWDPDGESLGTHRAYLEGVEDGYDYVLNLPIEFYSENTDTLFYHAMVNYEDFPGYDVYDVIDYPKSKWDEPYTKHFRVENTDIHYLGVPAGPRYRPFIADAMFEALDSILSNGQPSPGNAQVSDPGIGASVSHDRYVQREIGE